MKKVLILTAGFGEGHNAAARNVRDALDRASEEVKVEVLDLFESAYGSLNDLVRRAYLGTVKYAPVVWGGLYRLLDNSRLVGNNLGGFTRLRSALGDILHQAQPDCVVSTYPIYAHVVHALFHEHHERPFRMITVVTDSISINSAWFRAPSDFYCVANAATADVLRAGGVMESQIKVLGFPVSPLFAESEPLPARPLPRGERRRVLYIINTGKKKAGKAIDRLLEIPDVHLTITVGRDAELKEKLAERTRKQAHRVNLLGWTNQLPRLMLNSHLIIGKAGGATVQEAIAAQCPMIVNQVIPGQEEGNARLITEHRLGVVAEGKREASEWVQKAFAHESRLWLEWRGNLARLSRPDAAQRIAELVLAECDGTHPRRKEIKLFSASDAQSRPGAPAVASPTAKMLLCDFHMHSNYSDGRLTVPELIDFYGHRGFDCICVTDHLADPRRVLGKLARLSTLTLGENQLEEYFDVLERERRRAWRKYSMLVMTGMEFNKDGFTKKTSAHLLGLDLKVPIPGSMDLPETIACIHGQGGLTVASHPHLMKSHWGKNTLFLWDHQDQFAPIIDAWEIANRNHIFAPIGLKRLPFIANSDFHKPKHINSWKTLLFCDKDPEAIKECVRRNQHVSITLYRDEPLAGIHAPGLTADELAASVIPFQASLPLIGRKA